MIGEKIAELVYSAMVWASDNNIGVVPTWRDGGNSIAQDNARATARKIEALTEACDASPTIPALAAYRETIARICYYKIAPHAISGEAAFEFASRAISAGRATALGVAEAYKRADAILKLSAATPEAGLREALQNAVYALEYCWREARHDPNHAPSKIMDKIKREMPQLSAALSRESGS